MARYVPTNPPVTTDVQQLERWLREEYDQVRTSTDDIYEVLAFALEAFAASGYGMIGKNQGKGITIDGTWRTLTDWDVAPLSEYRAVTPNLPNGFIVEDNGIWRMSFALELSFAEANQGRTIETRFINETDGLPGTTESSHFIARNQPGANLIHTSLAESAPGTTVDNWVLATTKAIAIQVRSPDAFTGVSWDYGNWSVNRVSEYRGDFGVSTIESLDPKRH